MAKKKKVIVRSCTIKYVEHSDGIVTIKVNGKGFDGLQVLGILPLIERDVIMQIQTSLTK